MNQVLVTGARGFIGRRLLSRLTAADVTIRATTRRNPPEFMGGDVEWVPVDLSDETFDIRDLCKDCHSVVHLAGLAHKPSSKESDYRLYNSEATRRLAQAASDSGISHFLFISTAGVFGNDYSPADNFNGYSEIVQPSPRDAYAISKAEAEYALADIAKKSDMHYTILRPPMVYGPGAPANFRQLMRGIDMGLPLPLGSVKNLRSLIFVDNLCDLIYRFLDRQDHSGGVYGVADTAVSAPDLVTAIATALGVKSRLFPFPVTLLNLAGILAGRKGMIERLTRSFVVDDSLLRSELGWEPPVSLEVGMQMTAEWYRKTVSSKR